MHTSSLLASILAIIKMRKSGEENNLYSWYNSKTKNPSSFDLPSSPGDLLFCPSRAAAHTHLHTDIPTTAGEHAEPLPSTSDRWSSYSKSPVFVCTTQWTGTEAAQLLPLPPVSFSASISLSRAGRNGEMRAGVGGPKAPTIPRTSGVPAAAPR